MRYRHADLPNMTAGEKARELERLRLRIQLEDRPDAWLLRRKLLLEEEVRRGW